MIIAVGGGTDFNCQWNASTWSDEGKKKTERTKVEKNKKTKVQNESINRKGRSLIGDTLFNHTVFQPAPRRFRDQFILKIWKSAGFQTQLASPLYRDGYGL